MTEMSRNMYRFTWNNLNPQPLFHVPLCMQKVKHNEPQYFFTAELGTGKNSRSEAVTLTHAASIIFLFTISILCLTVLVYILEFQIYMYLMSVGKNKIQINICRCCSNNYLWVESNPDKGWGTFLQKCQNKPQYIQECKNPTRPSSETLCIFTD